MTELEITLDFLEEPITAEFYALAGAPGRDGADGQDGADGHTPVITASKHGHRTTVYVDGSAVAQIDDGADGQDGEDGQDGHSPVITASKSSGVTTISVDGVAVATISDGVDGQDGAKGDTGAAGHSPVVTASKSGKVTTVSVDGSPIATINDGEDGQDGQDGSDGQDGFSPSASVSKSGSTATITMTDKNGTTTATVSDGQDGADGQDGHTPVKGTDYWTAADKAEIVSDVVDEVGTKVENVSGSTPSITAQANRRYICGTVSSISFTPCASGICDVIFTSGSTPAVLTMPNTVKLPEWFSTGTLEANTTYEINVLDGVYGAVMAWA